MRILNIPNSTTSPSTDDYVGVDGSVNGTRKIKLFNWIYDHYFAKTDTIPVANGGTGATTAAAARTNLQTAPITVTGTISGAITTVNDSRITSDMEIPGNAIVLGTPSAITSKIDWQTGNGFLKLTTTVATNQSSTFVAYLSEVR